MEKSTLRQKVMIVDDDKELLGELKEALSLNDYDAVGLDSGAAALNIAPTLKPDIILLDLKMEEMSGFEVAKRLKHMPETAYIPIIAMTGCFTEKEHALAMEMFGMRYCLNKPFKPQDAITQIEKVLREVEYSLMSDDLNILLVEDDRELRREIGEILSEEGYKVMGVGTYAHASEELKKSFYNLVLVDIKLPDGSGVDLLKEIRRLSRDTITVILTAWASVENSVSALNEGAFAYIQKPFNVDGLVITVRKALRMQKYSFESRHLLNRLKELSITDALTGLYNYRYLLERLAKELERAKRYALPLSIAMLDIDFFKSINDVYGHEYGDRILKDFAEFLRDFIRGCDIVARYGGEEFVIILPNAMNDNAVMLGKRLLEAIGGHIFDAADKKIKLKVSMGISSFPENAGEINSASDFLSLADIALLEAKKTGRNKVSAYVSNYDIASGLNNQDIKAHIEKVSDRLAQMEKSVNQTLFESIYAFAKAIYAKEYSKREYADDMISTVNELSKKLNLSDKFSEDLKRAALLHDIGKIGIPDDILLKHGKITKEEYEIIKQHPKIAVEILKSINFLKDLIPIIFYHHERFDGLGYCTGLRGREIPIGARILSLIDVYQALVSDRPYRKAYTRDNALKIIKDGSGTQFDPELVEAFLTN